MTGRAVDVFDRPIKTCSGCVHWNQYHPIQSEHGYLQSTCQEADDIRDHRVKRASDYCSKWDKRK